MLKHFKYYNDWSFLLFENDPTPGDATGYLVKFTETHPILVSEDRGIMIRDDGYALTAVPEDFDDSESSLMYYALYIIPACAGKEWLFEQIRSVHYPIKKEPLIVPAGFDRARIQPLDI